MAAKALQRQHSDPLCAYIYDLDSLSQHVQAVVECLPPQCEMFYATKANPALPLLRTLAPWVHGLEVASGGELQWVQRHFPDVPVIFGGPGKLVSELQHAVESEVELIHVESLLELKRLKAITEKARRTQNILLRINLNLPEMATTRLTMGGVPTPFGMDEETLQQALSMLGSAAYLKLKGFHFHLMSHQLEPDRHLALMQAYFRRVRDWEKDYGLQIEQINVGGGIGINYVEPGQQFDWPYFCGKMTDLLEKEAAPEWCIRFECGRFLAAACGYYVTEVLDIKHSQGEAFAVCRGGTHHFRTPAAQSHNHPFEAMSLTDPAAQSQTGLHHQAVTLVGQLCTPKDVLARGVNVPVLDVGDLVIFTYAGAYAWNISHKDFLMHPPPVEYFLGETMT
ncbi:type III PLP-dependent enzyme [Marinobacter fonticola]|uniref:type III PLP-dependent enzyme n=1 Tax=Marinobacter fonticola TaxID=2603215 RepID=UPI001D0D895B|nr:type III PLP-dependent enzyme [Marinobacter fonticola]